MVEQSGSDGDFRATFLSSEDSYKPAGTGDIVVGDVVQITAEDVVVDVGLKGEGRVKRSEFTELGEDVKIGDRIEVKIVSIWAEEGTARLSRLRVIQDEQWKTVRDAFRDNKPVTGKIIGDVKGGFTVDVGLPFHAFLPRSQATLRKKADLAELEGQSFEFEIKELDRKRKNIVVSRRSLLEADMIKQRTATLAKIEPGQIIEGVVKSITNFGVFVDVGGIDGLIMLGDLTWSGFVKDAGTIVSKGETLKIKVLDCDRTKEPPRIRLGLKQVTGEPWQSIPPEVKPGATVDGTVKSFTNFGVFVELTPGVDGLAHISELTWSQHVKHPSEVLTLGDKVRVKVVSMDLENRKISLSIKQTAPDPWSQAADELLPGSRVTGTVSGVTKFGVFVRLPSGIEGMIHKSDLSWEKEIEDPGELYSVGQSLAVCVLRLDPEEKKLSLGVKQTQTDPWTDIQKLYQKNKIIETVVSRITPDGVIVDLEYNLTGIIPLGDLAHPRPTNAEDVVSVGETIRAKVVRHDRRNNRVFLSAAAVDKAEAAATVKNFMDDQAQSASITLGDLVVNEEIAARLKEMVSKSDK